MEQEFSFKEFFIYAIRKWIAVAFAMVISLGGFLGYFFIVRGDGSEIIAYTNTINFTLSIDDIWTESGKPEDFSSKYDFYRLLANQTFAKMNSINVKNEIYKKFKDTLYPNMKDDQASDLFFKSLVVNVDNSNLSIQVIFAHNILTQDMDKLNAVVVDVVDSYVEKSREAVIGTALNGNVIKGEDLPYGKTTRHYNVSNFFDVFGKFKASIGLTTAVLGGSACGFIIGAGIIILIYLFDKKVKSYRKISLNAGKLMGYVVSPDDIKNAAANICVTAGKNKTVALYSAQNDEMTADLAKEVAKQSAFAGLKTVVVQFGADSNKDFYEGLDLGNLSSAVTKIDGFDWVQGGDVWKMNSLSDKFFESIKGYDKVVLVSDSISDGVLGTLNSICDCAIAVLNNDAVTEKLFIRATEYFVDNEGNKTAGVVIHNLTKSFVK